ncbi:MAG: Lrp/AsnC family transcriptional regulator [Candidatus Nanoarchaeia archaeon]
MLSRKELLFLSCLRQSARKNLTTISREVGMPVSTLFERLKKFEKSQIIKHTSLLDFNELGYTTRAKMLVGTKKKDRDALRNFLSKSEFVNSVFKITNGYDFMVEVIFRSMSEMEMFIEQMEEKFSITKNVSYYVIEDIEREKFLTEKGFGNTASNCKQASK